MKSKPVATKSLPLWWFKARVRLANWLVRLARRVRPNAANGLLQGLEDAFIFGTGITRIDPRNFTEGTDLVNTSPETTPAPVKSAPSAPLTKETT